MKIVYPATSFAESLRGSRFYTGTVAMNIGFEGTSIKRRSVFLLPIGNIYRRKCTGETFKRPHPRPFAGLVDIHIETRFGSRDGAGRFKQVKYVKLEGRLLTEAFAIV